jgi:hypothetical protein
MFIILFIYLFFKIVGDIPPDLELGGNVEKYYSTPIALNGDFTSLIKISDVKKDKLDFFLRKNNLTKLDHTTIVLTAGNNFFESQDWWPDSSYFNESENFFHRDLDKQFEYFVSWKDGLCYISYMTW